jgi:ABC-type xylose transport system permease subunit
MTARSRAELRKFGLVVGGLFGLVGTVSWWRGHVVAPRVCWTLGGPLVVAGLVAPMLLAPVERVWMRFAEALGAVNARIILTALYYVVVTPIAWMRRRAGDPLDRRLHDGTASSWVLRERRPVDPARYRQQF